MEFPARQSEIGVLLAPTPRNTSAGKLVAPTHMQNSCRGQSNPVLANFFIQSKISISVCISQAWQRSGLEAGVRDVPRALEERSFGGSQPAATELLPALTPAQSHL